MDKREFQELVWAKGRELYRAMPWRDTPTLYYVLVSELMLQQTQVSRVLVKFDEFIEAFPTIDELAQASLADVVKVWQGLGYNRRAKYLHEAAKRISSDDELRQRLVLSDNPNNDDISRSLVELPGVGKNTAAAIMNYVYETPTPYIETNIRTVYFNHFFSGVKVISDAELIIWVEKTIDNEHPREWFWALMDYGAWLKTVGAGKLDSSKHYKKQAPLKGSIREVRGALIKALSRGDIAVDALPSAVPFDERFEVAYQGLIQDGLISETAGIVHLTK